MPKNYDQENIFSKIIEGKISAQKIYEDDFAIAINDINPASDIHILVMPKGKFTDFADFIQRASKKEIIGYNEAINKIIENEKITHFRLVTNCGTDAGQSVFHFHTHILSGNNLSELINTGL